ncbi:BON domain-containing protein [Luteolibacter luteus]|uniref:BON domain-containing protein n=1 Tax=Luteolibacter luteus TaxID=2728835 RepID=A0A858RJP1_9BACT|nr:BON domain-containing protein [Luteolibacter luteus]QJE97137.1 BON domain-containing protein [Luteolibacter luteus]
MKTPILFRATRWMILAAAVGLASATPEFGPQGDSDTADFIEMDVKADNRMIGSKVEVAVENGIATLNGTAISLEQTERAAARAMATAEIRAVVNRLRIIDPVAKDAVLAERVQQRLSKSEAIDASRIRVIVDGRKATLAGQVGSWDEQELAREIATEIPGLKEISNRLEVTFDTVRTDSAIKAQILHMVHDDPLCQGITIDVKVKDGVVSLGGEVGSPGEKDQLVHRSHVTGVTEVWADDIMVNRDLAMEGMNGKITKPSDTLRVLEDAFAADPRLKGADIQASAAGNQVTLTGTAPNDEARAAAESTARGIPGVMIVANEVRVAGGVSQPTAAISKDQRLATVVE